MVGMVVACHIGRPGYRAYAPKWTSDTIGKYDLVVHGLVKGQATQYGPNGFLPDPSARAWEGLASWAVRRYNRGTDSSGYL